MILIFREICLFLTVLFGSFVENFLCSKNEMPDCKLSNSLVIPILHIPRGAKALALCGSACAHLQQVLWPMCGSR